MCAALTKCLETRDSAIVHLLSLEKQSKQGRIRGFFQIPKFFEDKLGARTLGARSGGSKNVTYILCFHILFLLDTCKDISEQYEKFKISTYTLEK